MVLLMSSGVVHDVLFLLNVLPYSSSTRSNVHYVHLRGGRWPVKKVARRSHIFTVTVTCHLALLGLLLRDWLLIDPSAGPTWEGDLIRLPL